MMRSRWHLAVPLLLALVLSACSVTAEDSAGSGGLAGACLEGATECDDMGGDMGAPAPDEPVSDEPVLGGGGDADGGAEKVEPQDGLVDLRPVGWEEVQVDADDQSRVTVYWTSGVQECNALAEVEVEYGDDAITLTVIEGTPPSDEPMACIELAVRKQTTVELSEEVGPRSIRDGADT